jgi:hypothetical protein
MKIRSDSLEEEKKTLEKIVEEKSRKLREMEDHVLKLESIQPIQVFLENSF